MEKPKGTTIGFIPKKGKKATSQNKDAGKDPKQEANAALEPGNEDAGKES